MKKNYFVLLVACSILLLSACGKKKSGGSFSVDKFSNGKAGEIILIMGDQVFTPEAQKKVSDTLQQPQPGINQIEPMFDILHFQPKDFTSEFVRHRNIVHFDINPDYGSNHITFETNAWSSPQMYIKIKGNQADSAIALFMNNKEKILRSLYDNDLRRIQNYYAKEINHTIEKTVKDKFGILLSIPNHYFIASEEKDFLWLRFRTAKNDRFIMVYKMPAYELTEANLIATRDTITKRYVPGAIKGAYPIVAQKFGFPIVKNIQIGTKKGVEMRGIWESVHDKMGGPFYSFTFLSPDGKNCITVDGFVYAPQENKRDYLREVEAIVKSLR
ncbi:MAG: DUF4837 family protein [Bacteroidales bacterium]